MAILNKLDSNSTGLRVAEEESYKVLPTTPTWIPLEPNSYPDFGGEVTTVARNPINPSRQRKKGVVTDLDAKAGYDTDVTQTNLQSQMQGFMFADLRRKVEFGGASEITATTTSTYDAASGLDAFAADDLVMAAGFTNAANNGLKTVVTALAAVLTVLETLVVETPPATATLVRVGVETDTGDLDVDVSGSLPALTSTVLDFTTLGLIVGEYVYVGGDETAEQFANSENNGFARVRSIAANRLEFDKTEQTMVVEANTTLTVRLFFGRVLKNETGTLIKRRTYQFERTLGAPDTAQPTQIQAEYIPGCVPGEFTLNVPTAEKMTATLVYTGADSETQDKAVALKTGNRPALVEADAFNTSSDVARVKLAVVTPGDPAPTALFAFMTEMTITINNNVKPNKAVGVLGAFEVTAGTFEVGGDITAYFSDVAAVAAVRANSDITIEMHTVKENAGITYDIPLITLGDGRPAVEQDEPITLPLNMAAASGAKIDSDLDHTLLVVYWDYLPNAAEV